MAKAKTVLDKVNAQLGQLSREELELLAGTVDRLLAISEPVEEETEEVVIEMVAKGKASKSRAHGHIEHKEINGYGPYAYLRVWKGKTLTSTYLGKVGENGAIAAA